MGIVSTLLLLPQLRYPPQRLAPSRHPRLPHRLLLKEQQFLQIQGQGPSTPFLRGQYLALLRLSP